MSAGVVANFQADAGASDNDNEPLPKVVQAGAETNGNRESIEENIKSVKEKAARSSGENEKATEENKFQQAIASWRSMYTVVKRKDKQ